MSDFSDLQAFLESQLSSGYAFCQSRGVKYFHKGTVAFRTYRCVTEGESRASLIKKRQICKLGPNACDAGFTARYHVDSQKQPYGSVALLRVKLEHRHAPTFLGQPVPQSVKVHIESQLQLGVDPVHLASKLQQKALDRRNREAPLIDRVSFLPKSYFKARNRILNSKAIEMDKNDYKSVALSIKERWQDSVLFYHPLGCDGDGLSPKVFCLVIASCFQQSLLERYGTSVHMAFFDGTHGVVKYRNFSLFTMLVINDEGHGYPAGWMLANSKDMTVQSRFLRVLQSIVPKFEPGAFMVDEDPAARGALEKIFPHARVYFCDFHLWRAWGKRLGRLNLAITPEMEDHLVKLRRSAHEEEFEHSLEALRKNFSETVNGQKFWEYLLSNYLYKRKYWAGYLRYFQQPTNNHLESWHNNLKTNHLKRKSKMRIDHFVHCLLERVELEIFQKALRSAPDLGELLKNSRSKPQNVEIPDVTGRNLHSIKEEHFIAFLLQPKILDLVKRDERFYSMFMESQYTPLRIEGPNKKMSLQ